LKKHSKSCRQSEPTTKRAKSRGPVQRDAKEVMAEVLEKLTGRGALDARAESGSARKGRRENTVGPNGSQSSATLAVSAYSSLGSSRVAVSVESSTELLWSIVWGGLRQF
jgi:hypothetical protein